MPDDKKSPVESEKENSNYLRGTIREQLTQTVSHFDDSVKNLLKFHGTYQQDDRDERQSLTRAGKEKHYMMMVRTKTPGGKMTADQYLVMDQLADAYGNGTLRITTRQGIQFHGVLKKNVKKTIAQINQALVTTLGACGDVVRNVCGCPAPFESHARAEISEYAKKISDHLLPRTRAYHEIWLDEEKVASTQEEIEPLYGKAYLPRKFKIAIAYPGDNCVDVYTHDLGLIPEIRNQQVEGFHLVVGGGLGMTHRKPETHPLLAKPLGYVPENKVFEAIDAVIKVQRDYGNRSNRMRARLKYLIEEKGMPWFLEQVHRHLDFKLGQVKELQWANTDDHLGWHSMSGGKFFYGLFVQNGRIKDEGNFRLRSALREIVGTFNPTVHFTLQQNVILSGLSENQKMLMEGILKKHGVQPSEEVSMIERWSMACPALPTCGLAMAEAERVLPKMLVDLRAEIKTLGLDQEKITLRMTGCPNGCSRPYSAEIGLVGSGLGTYALFLNGNFEGTRLNEMIAFRVKETQVVESLKPILSQFKSGRRPGEAFGDFCFRLGKDALVKMLPEGVN